MLPLGYAAGELDHALELPRDAPCPEDRDDRRDGQGQARDTQEVPAEPTEALGGLA